MYWLNGEAVDAQTLELAIDDPGLLFGATVFTTLRVYESSLDHRLTGWKQHCDRIRTSLETFHWAQPDWERLRRGAEVLRGHYPVLRITLFPDGRELITGRHLPADLALRQNQGVTAWEASPAYGRTLPEHKTGNYLACWLAAQAAKTQGAAEAILVDEAGSWLETSTGTLWGWAQGQWWTPPLAVGILPGVVRSQLLAHLNHQRYPVQESQFTSSQVQQFECLAYTNSVVELVPIHTVLRGRIRLEYNPNCKALQALWSYWTL